MKSQKASHHYFSSESCGAPKVNILESQCELNPNIIMSSVLAGATLNNDTALGLFNQLLRSGCRLGNPFTLKLPKGCSMEEATIRSWSWRSERKWQMLCAAYHNWKRKGTTLDKQPGVAFKFICLQIRIKRDLAAQHLENIACQTACLVSQEHIQSSKPVLDFCGAQVNPTVAEPRGVSPACVGT